MATLREEDWRAGLRLMQAVGAAADDADAFARAGVQALPRLVASELTTLSVCDLLTGRREVTAAPDSVLSAADRDCFDRFFREHPLVRFHADLRGSGAHRISDSLPFARFRNTALYHEYYRRIRIDHVLALPVQVDSRTLVSFVLNRRGRDFSERDCNVLDLVREPLAQAWRQAQAMQRARTLLAGLAALLERSGSAWMRLGPGRTLCDASPRALAQVLEHTGVQAMPGRHLPPLLDHWFEAAMRGPGEAARRELVLVRAGARLRVTALPAAPGGDGFESGAFLLFEAQEALASPARFEALALTPREREVMRWLAAGKTDREIAVLLGCSHRTVQKHLERVYVKLGVETRTAAVMRALEMVLH